MMKVIYWHHFGAINVPIKALWWPWACALVCAGMSALSVVTKWPVLLWRGRDVGACLSTHYLAYQYYKGKIGEISKGGFGALVGAHGGARVWVCWVSCLDAVGVGLELCLRACHGKA